MRKLVFDEKKNSVQSLGGQLTLTRLYLMFFLLKLVTRTYNCEVYVPHMLLI